MLVFICVVLAIIALLAYHTLVLALVIGAWFAFLHLAPVKFVVAHPWLTVAYVCGYLAIGAAYSVIKWFLEERDRARTAREEFNRQFVKDGVASRSWADHAARYKTTVSYYTTELILYVTFWPISGAWTLLHDPVTRIVQELRGVYQRITDYAWR